VIAVNRAAHVWACDVWAAIDYRTVLEHHDSLGYIPAHWLTNLAQQQTLAAKGVDPAPFEPVSAEDLDKLPGAPAWSSKYWMYSSTLALVYAGLVLGAKSIDVFGYDGAGRQDFDGLVDPRTNRSDKRWQIEAGIWADVEAWLRGRNCDGVRHSTRSMESCTIETDVKQRTATRS
jgi:hypothetical protein